MESEGQASLIPTGTISNRGEFHHLPSYGGLSFKNYFFATTMVTRTVIRITSSEAEQWAAIAAAAENNNAGAIEKTEFKQPSESSKITASPAATLDQDSEQRKRPLPLWRDATTNDQATTMKRRRQRKNISVVIDLSDVPTQPPIPKSSGRAKAGTSKYTGVCFNKQYNKWQASINWGGKFHYIGCYDDEMEAAVDYARALYKYKGGVKRQRQGKSFATIDLSDVPTQPPIPKSSRHVKEGASKYTGVCFNKHANKWQAQISIYGKQHAIGRYDNEEEAAVDYARAVFKYKGGKVHRRFVDLSDVPPQPPILKSSRHVKGGASKYTGVAFSKQCNRWVAQIMIEGKQRFIGYYDDEEEAAVDYARAVFKYK